MLGDLRESPHGLGAQARFKSFDQGRARFRLRMLESEEIGCVLREWHELRRPQRDLLHWGRQLDAREALAPERGQVLDIARGRDQPELDTGQRAFRMMQRQRERRDTGTTRDKKAAQLAQQPLQREHDALAVLDAAR
jgi:hypothetical protein